MDCVELMQLPELSRGLHLIAGKAGIHRSIRWIYFADCIQCVGHSENPADFIHGGELVIITNVSITEHDDFCLELVQSINQKDISALAINEGQISQKVKDYCEEMALPLFELDMNLHLVDLSQIICRKLLAEEGLVSSRERLLTQILESDHLERSQLVQDAQYLGVSLNEPASIAVFQIRGNAQGSVPARIDRIKRECQTAFQSAIQKAILLTETSNSVIVLVPEAPFTREDLTKLCDELCDRMTSLLQVPVHCGIGLPYEYIEDYRNSLREAMDSLEIGAVHRWPKNVYFYEDLGIDSVLLQIRNGKFMDEYVDACLGKLMETDKVQGGSLFHTLEVYLSCNASANESASILFIHRNTMQYRLGKIRQILGVDLSDLSTLLKLKLAYSFYHYRHAQEEGA
ncbi:MAG: PucR family transcriptional regulator [Lachnospiraceae bacterium]